MPLTTLIDLQGVAGWAAMLAPLLVLAIALTMALVDRGPRKDDGPARGTREAEAPPAPAYAERAAPAASAPTPAPVKPEPRAGSAPTPVPRPAVARGPAPRDATTPKQVASPPPAVAKPQPPPAPAPAPPAAKPAKPAPPPPDLSTLRTRLHAAEASLDNAAVAGLALELGRRLAETGGTGEDVEKYLRRSIIAASQVGDTATHAAARLELGDRVAARGDMTTACEHWQIARQIFWDESRQSDLADADRRMIAAGCPTDWVLNDF